MPKDQRRRASQAAIALLALTGTINVARADEPTKPSAFPETAPANPDVAKEAPSVEKASKVDEDKKNEKENEKEKEKEKEKEPEKVDAHWYDGFTFGAFVDFYAAMNWNTPPDTRAIFGHSNDQASGLSLNWIGLNLSHPADPIGGMIQLRYGPGATLLFAPDRPNGLGNVKQAYGSWKPGGKEGSLTLSVGKFTHPFGFEELDTQPNINYTQTFLYTFAQPASQTGVTADYVFGPEATLKLWVVNGWEYTIDNNQGKSGGFQAIFTPSAGYTIYLGYEGGPEKDDTCPDGTFYTLPSKQCTATGKLGTHIPGSSDLRHFVDVIVDANLSKHVRMVMNANYGLEKNSGAADTTWYGANLTSSYAIGEHWMSALRGEGYHDNGFAPGVLKPGTNLAEGTVTVGYIPSSHLIIKLDNRLDLADRPVYPSKNGIVDHQTVTVLGVVVTTE
jgi:hypothetical protein